jgi:hypothetical protein
LVQRNGARAAAAARTRFFMILSISRSADLAGLVDRVAISPGSDPLFDQVAPRDRDLREQRWRRRVRRSRGSPARAPLATVTLVQAEASKGRRNDNHRDYAAEEQFLHDSPPSLEVVRSDRAENHPQTWRLL